MPRFLPSFAALLLFTHAASAGPWQFLSGHVLPQTTNLQPIGALAPSQQLTLAISLPLRNEAQLDTFLDQLYNRAVPNYHHYLSVSQFTGQFGPSIADYDKLIAFARANGLNVTATHPNRLVLSVSAPVAQIEKTFHVHLRQYQHPTESRLFYAPDAEPSVDLDVPILHISGLDNFYLPQPGAKIPDGTEALKTPAAIPRSGSGPSGSYRGSDFRNAYAPGVGLTGAGQSIALVEFDGYVSNDIAAYESQSGITPVPLTNVLIDGFNGVAGDGENDEFEVSLDIEMAAAMAPGLSQIIVYETAQYGQAVTLLDRIASDNRARQVSCSWWFSSNAGTQQAFKEMAAQGQSFFIISGDNDAYNAAKSAAVLPPIDYSYITVVGGTALTTAADDSWSAERVWNFDNGSGSGGGVSSTYAIPSWQTPVNMSTNGGSTTHRNVPDVAAVANGLYVVYDNGATTEGGNGTSFSTPLWAAFTALANQQAAANGLPPIGFLNPLLYQIGQSSLYPTAFHDIVTGNNTNSASPTNFFAVPGYDLCTGWGSPTGSNLINLLAPAPIVLTPPTIIGGQIQFTVNNQLLGATNYLQASTDLSSPANWASIATNIAAFPNQTFSTPAPTNSLLFFRVSERP